MAESSPSTHKAEDCNRGHAYKGLIQAIKSCQTYHDCGSGSHRHTSAQSTHSNKARLNFESKTTIAFYKNSASLYSSDNPILVSQVKQPTVFSSNGSS